MRVIIDGNIGSGKTTQLDMLEKKGWRVHREPIDQWPLEEFYSDPGRWAFFFHMVILQTQRPLETSEPVVYERSLASSRHVFWPVLLENGTVTSQEDETYSKFYDQYAWSPDLFIFLDKSPEKAFEHIQTRGQAGDSAVTLEYLKLLDTQYKKLLHKIHCPVLVIDAESSPEKIHAKIYQYLTEQNELFQSHSERNKVQTEGGRGWEVPRAPFTDLCCLPRSRKTKRQKT